MREQHRKWWRWLGEPSTSGGVIGRYEGGMYATKGVWRPSEHSMMKTLGYAYDQVGARAHDAGHLRRSSNLVQDEHPGRRRRSAPTASSGWRRCTR